MAYLLKRKNRKNWYIAIWLAEQKTKKLLSTHTTNRKKAEIFLKKVQMIQDLKKTESKALEIIYEEHLKEQGLFPGSPLMHHEPGHLLLKGTCEKFLKSRENEISADTLKSYKLGLKDLQSSLGSHYPVSSLKRGDYDRLLAYLRGHYNVSTINIRLRSIRVFLYWLVDFDFISKLPFKIKQLKNDKLPKFIPPPELKKVYSFVTDQRLLSAFKVYEATGMRLSELNTSKLEGSFLRIVGKGSKTRIIPLPNEHRDDYQIAIAAQFSTDFISKAFTTCWRRSLVAGYPEYLKGKSIFKLHDKELMFLTFRILEKQYAAQLGKTELTVAEKRESHTLGHSLHSLRHTFALRSWIECRDLYQVRKLMGHSTISVTEHYAKFPPEYLKEIFQ